MGRLMSVRSDQAVSEVLAQWPQLAQVFVDQRMGCVGCPLARFETVAQAAQAYEMEELRLVGLLEQAIAGASGSKVRGGRTQRS